MEPRLDNPFEKKHTFSSFFAGPGPGPGPGPAKKDEKSEITGPLFAIFGRASGQILEKIRVLAPLGLVTLIEAHVIAIRHSRGYLFHTAGSGNELEGVGVVGGTTA